MLLQGRQCVTAGGRLDNFAGRQSGEQTPQAGANNGVVVHQQNVCHGTRASDWAASRVRQLQTEPVLGGESARPRLAKCAVLACGLPAEHRLDSLFAGLPQSRRRTGQTSSL